MVPLGGGRAALAGRERGWLPAPVTELPLPLSQQEDILRTAATTYSLGTHTFQQESVVVERDPGSLTETLDS